MFNPRPLFVVLQGSAGRHDIPITTIDPRRWESGKEYTHTLSASVPAAVASGVYALGLWLPDAASQLRSDPRFSVRFANSNVWEPASGLNVLTSNLKVGP